MRFLDTKIAPSHSQLEMTNGELFYGLECSCGEGCVMRVTKEQAAQIEGDAAIGLHLLSPKERQGILDFWQEHKNAGHTLEPTLCEIMALNESTS